jgi:hypothetical protein
VPDSRTQANEAAVQRFLDEIVAAERSAERRREARINISVVVAVIPCVNGQPVIEQAFATFTKNVSENGVALSLNRVLPHHELLLGFPHAASLRYVRSEVHFRESLPLGCSLLGVRLHEIIDDADYPALSDLTLGAKQLATGDDLLPIGVLQPVVATVARIAE